jgi:restriction system protein
MAAMDIKFSCPRCALNREIDETGAGRQIFCPNCGEKLIVPSVSPRPLVANVVREGSPSYGTLPREAITKRLGEMDWFQFEKLIEMVYAAQKCPVTRRGGAKADGGIDLIVEKNGAKVAVQCKHWKSWKVGVRNIRELKGAMTIENMQKGVLVTIVGYTEEARTLAEEQGIALLDQGKLLDLIDQAELRHNEAFAKNLLDDTKYCPRCDVPLVLRTAEKGINRGNRFWACPRFPKCRYLVNI